MDVLAWEKRIIHEKRLDEKRKFEIYVFKNPTISAPRNKEECYRIDTVDFDYAEWEIVNETLSRKPKIVFLGKGFHEGCFCYLNGQSLDELSEKIEIEKKHLETILSDYESIQ